jgi:hypothetical protein
MRSNEVARDGRRHGMKNTIGRGALFGLSFAVLFSVGCTATLTAGTPTVAGYAVTSADAVPVGIDRYPRTYYQGEYAYLVDGLWYYPTATGWVIFQEEPRELAQYRARVQTAPAAKRPPDVQYGYPRPPPPRPTQPRELHREYRR